MNRRFLISTYAAVILILPFVIDVFEKAGGIFLGLDVVRTYGWIPTVLAYVPILVLLFIYLFATLKPKEEIGLKWSNAYLWTSIGIGVASAIIIYLIDSATGILSDFGAPSNPSAGLAIGFLLSWGLLAPFVEELFFRGMIQSSLFSMKKAKIHPSIWIATGLEVLFHFSFPLYHAPKGQVGIALLGILPQAAYVALFSFAASWIYYKTRSLTGPLVIHAIGNIGELLLFWLLN